MTSISTIFTRLAVTLTLSLTWTLTFMLGMLPTWWRDASKVERAVLEASPLST